MEAFVVKPLVRYHVIIYGSLAAAVKSAGYYSHHPLRKVHATPVAIHADMFADPQDMDKWFALSHNRQPGGLAWFRSSKAAR